MPGFEINLDFSEFDKFEGDIEATPEALMKTVEGRVAIRSVAKMRAYARSYVHVRTGQLRQRIESTQAQFINRKGEHVVEFGIGINLEYAVPEEYGVGPLGSPEVEHTPKRTWRYYNKAVGGWRTAKTRPEHPYLRPALKNVQPYVEQEMKQAVEKVLSND